MIYCQAPSEEKGAHPSLQASNKQRKMTEQQRGGKREKVWAGLGVSTH